MNNFWIVAQICVTLSSGEQDCGRIAVYATPPMVWEVRAQCERVLPHFQLNLQYQLSEAGWPEADIRSIRCVTHGEEM